MPDVALLPVGEVGREVAVDAAALGRDLAAVVRARALEDDLAPPLGLGERRAERRGSGSAAAGS